MNKRFQSVDRLPHLLQQKENLFYTFLWSIREPYDMVSFFAASQWSYAFVQYFISWNFRLWRKWYRVERL